MPELRLREVRLPELSLPEMSREDIVRAIGDVRRDIDLPEFDLRKVDLPAVDLPRIDLSKVDVVKAVTAATQAAGLVRRQRSRLPIIVAGAVAIAAIGLAIVMSPAVKPRLSEAARRWRERMDARRVEATTTTEPNADLVEQPVEPPTIAEIEPAFAPPVAEEVPTA